MSHRRINLHLLSNLAPWLKFRMKMIRLLLTGPRLLLLKIVPGKLILQMKRNRRLKLLIILIHGLVRMGCCLYSSNSPILMNCRQKNLKFQRLFLQLDTVKEMKNPRESMIIVHLKINRGLLTPRPLLRQKSSPRLFLKLSDQWKLHEEGHQLHRLRTLISF